MADTAAFFANKKKKKTFKFNANKVDASQVKSTDVHIDAPPISTSTDINKNNGGQGGDNGWDDEALAAKLSSAAVITSANTKNNNGPAELLDMKTLDRKQNNPDEVAERMRVEETKAQLAAAREGMEKEALRLKEEREASSSNSNTSSVNGNTTTGSWIAPHLRNTTSNRFSNVSVGGSSSGGGLFQRKLDTQDENLFPDLATADKIIAKEEELKQQQVAVITRKPKPSQNTTWGMKKNDPVVTTVESVKETQDEKVVESSDVTPTEDSTTTSSIQNPTVVAPTSSIKPKKKKKDLSTFKPSS